MKHRYRAFAHGAQGVSIHTRHYWRVKLPATLYTQALEIVSIHTRHYWRVKPVWDGCTLRPNQFQSTPAITGG